MGTLKKWNLICPFTVIWIAAAKCTSSVDVVADYRSMLSIKSLNSVLPIKVIFSSCTEFYELVSKYKAV